MTTECALGVGRSLSGRRWVWRTGEDRVGLGIAQRMDLPEIVGRLLAARGVGIEAADMLVQEIFSRYRLLSGTLTGPLVSVA